MIKYKERLKLAQEVLEGLTAVSEQLGTKVFKTKIRESTGTQQAQAQRTTVVKYDKKKLFFLSYFASLNCLIPVATGKGHSVVDIGAYERKEGCL